MGTKNRIIIDTDPGVDDILALLLAFCSQKNELQEDELEILLISVTFGNVEVLNCLRNVVSLFHVIEKELEWRKKTGHPEGLEALKRFRPRVALGADEPLADQILMADYFHGVDGLGGIHSSHPHLTPAETWRDLFTTTSASGSPEEKLAVNELQHGDTLFTPVQTSADKEILRLLAENDPDTITIIALGPLTNLARAAATAPETFLRAKEVVVMGGAISTPGNITPVSEFNLHADSIASARLLALTSPTPSSTLPPPPPAPASSPTPPPPPPFLAPYPEPLSRQLRLTLLPLDITNAHVLRRGQVEARLRARAEQGSPLAEWVGAFLGSTLDKVERLRGAVMGEEEEEDGKGGRGGTGEVALSLHDPLCVWYALTKQRVGKDGWSGVEGEDVRVETSGQWTRGMCVVDRRDRKKKVEKGDGEDVGGDHGGWLDGRKGNRVRRMMRSGEERSFGETLLDTIFGKDH
ncbi:nucleoside hydrolase [Viridothelium virens]|uniref:Nucleoside hydrolase n=1 Tax=Viridothelium virens TaxID=1048519 RepID=A0A6A6H8X8_VIRVR|nr:nucleoside hydrolase [Viridothelium virens]